MTDISHLKNTHLLEWLKDGWNHCRRGSQDWGQGYLDSAHNYIVALEKELAVRHRAQPYTYIGIDGKSVLARKLEDDLIAAKEDRRELLMAIENIARMTEQGVFSAEREQAAMEMRSLVPSRFRATEQEPT